MFNENLLEEFIYVLKNLLKAERDSKKMSMKCSDLIPRIGVRGGKATSLSAKWKTCAEHRDKLFNLSLEKAKMLFNLEDL